MTKKQKTQVKKGIFGLFVAFLILLLVFFNITVDAESANAVVKMHDFSVKLVNNVTENIIFYGLSIFAVLLGVYYLRKRK